jgi:L-asparaginase II
LWSHRAPKTIAEFFQKSRHGDHERFVPLDLSGKFRSFIHTCHHCPIAIQGLVNTVVSIRDDIRVCVVKEPRQMDRFHMLA